MASRVLLGDIASGARPRVVDRKQVIQATVQAQERIMGKDIEAYQVLLQQKDERIAQLERELARERQAVEAMGKLSRSWKNSPTTTRS